MRAHSRPVVALALALLVVTVPATADASTSTPPGRSNGLQRLVDQIVAAGAPGTILTVRNGSESQAFVAGIANMETGRRIHPGDRYRIGSVTKSFLATLVLQLVATGDLDLDATVEKYLPGLLPDGDTITLRQLLNHTSGLYNYTKDPAFLAAALAGEAFTPRQLIAYSTSHDPLFPPGKKFSYSNTNYIVLGLLVRSTGTGSIRQQLAERITTPLGLDATSLPLHAKGIRGRHAHGYDYLNGPELEDVTTTFSPTWAWTAGAIVSTEADVEEFYGALMSGELVEPALLEEMKKTVPATKGSRYGLGIFAYDLPCGTAWGHEGDVPGYHDWVVTSEDGSRQVAVMVNVGARRAVRSAISKAFVEAYCGTAGSFATPVLPDSPLPVAS